MINNKRTNRNQNLNKPEGYKCSYCVNAMTRTKTKLINLLQHHPPFPLLKFPGHTDHFRDSWTFKLVSNSRDFQSILSRSIVSVLTLSFDLCYVIFGFLCFQFCLSLPVFVCSACFARLCLVLLFLICPLINTYGFNPNQHVVAYPLCFLMFYTIDYILYLLKFNSKVMIESSKLLE